MNKISRIWVVLGTVVLSLVLLQQFWQWEIERVEVGQGKYLIRIHRWGADLPSDQIIAPDESYKGVMLDVLQEGRHFLNPIFWGYEMHDLVNVPTGQCLILTRKFGSVIPSERLAEGDILAKEGERGIVPDVLKQGSYRLNPYAYSWEMVKAVEIGPDQVGVRTLKVGKDSRALPADPKNPQYVVPDGYRGVQKTPVEKGTYYLNQYVESITAVEVRSHRAELTDIEFPSRDGFILKPHVMVEYQVKKEKAPEVMVRLTDEGKLHQADSTPQEQEQNEILQKVLLPHIRGYARIEGSTFDARDFIVTGSAAGNDKMSNTRERLQKALLDKVRPRCEELGIEIRAVLLGEMKPPVELAEQIAQRDIARVKQEQNKSMVGQYQEEQKLQSIQTMKQQNREKVEAQTRLLVSKTQSQQLKQVEELRLKQELESAQIRLEAAKARAEAILSKGKAESAVTTAQNEAEVAGLRKAIQGFSSTGAFAQYQVLKQMAPALREIFASDDSDFAKFFSTYLSAPPGGLGKLSPPIAENGRTAPEKR